MKINIFIAILLLSLIACSGNSKNEIYPDKSDTVNIRFDKKNYSIADKRSEMPEVRYFENLSLFNQHGKSYEYNCISIREIIKNYSQTDTLSHSKRLYYSIPVFVK